MKALLVADRSIESCRTAPSIGVALLCSGCDLSQYPVLDARGPVALAERDLLLTALVVMLIVVIPVFVMTFLFVVRYRFGGNARYTPNWSYSAGIDAVVWLVPALIVIALGVLVWMKTHQLNSYKSIDAAAQPLDVQVVAQDWKWVFIYPEANSVPGETQQVEVRNAAATRANHACPREKR